MIMKLNNRGYMLVEVIVSFTLAIIILFFMTNATISLKNKADDLYLETKLEADQLAMTTAVMKDINSLELKTVDSSSANSTKECLILGFESKTTKIEYDKTNNLFKYGELNVTNPNNVNCNTAYKNETLFTKKMDSRLNIDIGSLTMDSQCFVGTEYKDCTDKDKGSKANLKNKISGNTAYSNNDYGLLLDIPYNYGEITIIRKPGLYDACLKGAQSDENLVLGLPSTINETLKSYEIDGKRVYIDNNTDNGNGNFIASSTKNDDFPICYYRGKEDKNNNNVIFDGYCWKMVMSTSTGGFKMIYNGTPYEGKCPKDGVKEIDGKRLNSTELLALQNKFIGTTPYNRKETDYNQKKVGIFYYENPLSTDDSTSYKTRRVYSNTPAHMGYMYGNPQYLGSSSFQLSSDGSWEIDKAVGAPATGVFEKKLMVADDVTYNSTTKKYTLVNPSTAIVKTNGDMTPFMYKYSCMSEETSCSTVKYTLTGYMGWETKGGAYEGVTNSFFPGQFTYIELTNGKKYADAIKEMLSNNTNSSNVKEYLEKWYKKNIKNKDYIDIDTEFCYNRENVTNGNETPKTRTKRDTIEITFSINYKNVGFNYNFHGEPTHSGNFVVPQLQCSRDIDKFSAKNAKIGNKSLEAPIGLLTLDEALYAGFSTYNKASLNSYQYSYFGNHRFILGTPYNYRLVTTYVNDKSGGQKVLDLRSYFEDNFYSISRDTSQNETIGLVTKKAGNKWTDYSGKYDQYEYEYSSEQNVRPVIAIDNKVQIQSGEGTNDKPYILTK